MRPVATATAPSTLSATAASSTNSAPRNGPSPGRPTSNGTQKQSSTPATVTAVGLTRSRPSTYPTWYANRSQARTTGAATRGSNPPCNRAHAVAY